MGKYLGADGLSYLWGKIKSYTATNADVLNSMKMTFGIIYGGYDTESIVSDTWKSVLVDSENKIIAGLGVDNKLYFPDLEEED